MINLLNYFDEDDRIKASIIGLVYDYSKKIEFNESIVIPNDIKYYCIKLFAVNFSYNASPQDWKLTNGFICVASKGLEVGSIVKFKGTLSWYISTPRQINMLQFKKQGDTFELVPLIPQSISSKELSRMKVGIKGEFTRFSQEPYLYNLEVNKVIWSEMPIDHERRSHVGVLHDVNFGSYEDKSVIRQSIISEIPIETQDFVENKRLLPIPVINTVEEFLLRLQTSNITLNNLDEISAVVSNNYIEERAYQLGYSVNPCDKTYPLLIVSKDIFIKDVDRLELNNINLIGDDFFETDKIS